MFLHRPTQLIINKKIKEINRQNCIYISIHRIVFLVDVSAPTWLKKHTCFPGQCLVRAHTHVLRLHAGLMSLARGPHMLPCLPLISG
jgi:hypothetical protein